jgi:GAF domain-containing protein
VLASEGDELRVIAVAGTAAGWRVGQTVAADAEGVGYVLASGQPLSLAAERPGAHAVLCVPCMHESEPIGAMELLGGAAEDPFPLEATGIAGLFAQIAGAAIAAGSDAAAAVPSPRELGAELARIEASDPTRYASLARAVGALLS